MLATRKKTVDPRNAEIVKRQNYHDALCAIQKGGFCPFCEEHLFKHHTRPLIFKSKHWLVTENAWPYEGSKFHFLFISRAHLEKTERMSPSMWADLQKQYRKLVEIHKLPGATLLMRSGSTKITGASVNHLHAQLIVGKQRKKGSESIRAVVGFK